MLRKFLVGGGLVLTSIAAVAAPAAAHDCFNPTKAPGAGSKGVVTLDANGNEVGFTQTGNGNGGFITIDAGAIQPGLSVDIHTFGGQSGPKDGTAGPGSDKAGAKACDGKGIDYADACFGEG
jgi:hypothetical protein